MDYYYYNRNCTNRDTNTRKSNTQRRNNNDIRSHVNEGVNSRHTSRAQLEYRQMLAYKRRRRALLRRRIKLIFTLFWLAIIFMVVFVFGVKTHDQPVSDKITDPTASNDSQINSESSVLLSSETQIPLSERSFSSWNNSCDWSMRLINSVNLIPDTYEVNTVIYQNEQVDVRILPYLKDMIQAASNDGIILQVVSAYRTNEKQKSLYDAQVKKEIQSGYDQNQAKEVASSTVARPGSSEHEAGLAVDFNNVTEEFTDTKEYEWLKAHCYKYGFIQRYERQKSDITKVINEPWHYRFVGTENAKLIVDSGLCLEEYISKMEQGE